MATAGRQAATPRSTAPAVSRRARANPARLPAPATHGLRGERARGQTLVADAVAFDGSPWVNALASASLVLGTALSTAAGAYFIRRGVERGVIDLGAENPAPKRSVKPLEQKGASEPGTEGIPAGSGEEEELLESNSTERR
mmetsp:Transcript_30836/g.79199  ORF Transcript_30836/g.79199 Transcript_30836/m.79199 type:complete len:141 (+) Transcript_30836:144-566(+)|eukprot:jgi/Tetstr1/420343/TSEL_011463.t1